VAQPNELGACSAILSGISTKVDGSLKITLEVNPDEQKIISNLLNAWSLNKRLMTVAFIQVEQ
jgi:hypothetical protein